MSAARMTFDVTFTYHRLLPPLGGNDVVEVEVEGGVRYAVEQVVTVAASDEAAAIEAAEPFKRDGVLASATATRANRWTVSGDLIDRQHEPILFWSGETYPSRREALENAASASDVRDRITRSVR